MPTSPQLPELDDSARQESTFYKLSKFNVDIESNDEHYYWNTYSGSLIHLDQEGLTYVHSFPSDLNHPFFNILKDNGFVVSANDNELERIIKDEQTALYDSMGEDCLTLVIAPGMGCQFKCVYCFEAGRNKSKHMTSQTMEHLVNFVTSTLDAMPCVRRVSCKWFGGEPLLYLDAIISLSQSFISLCSARQLRYEAGIVTNGRLLDEQACQMLHAVNVNWAQITVDGTCDLYCRDKGVTPRDFYAVINNIETASRFFHLTLRLNITSRSHLDAIAITDFLQQRCPGITGRATFDFAFVKTPSSDKQFDSACYDYYAHEWLLWARDLIDKGGIELIKGLAPHKKQASCGCIRQACLCVGPDGSLTPCEEGFGVDALAYGNVVNGTTNSSVCQQFKCDISSRHNGKCLSCAHLPVCMGHCAHDELSSVVGMTCNSYKTLANHAILISAGIRP